MGYTKAQIQSVEALLTDKLGRLRDAGFEWHIKSQQRGWFKFYYWDSSQARPTSQWLNRYGQSFDLHKGGYRTSDAFLNSFSMRRQLAEHLTGSSWESVKQQISRSQKSMLKRIALLDDHATSSRPSL